MDRQEFLEQVTRLSGEGKSIRNIATELDVHRSRVHRALKVVTSAAMDEMTEKSEPTSAGKLREGVFVGRQREMDQLRASLDDAVSGNARIVALSGEPGIGKTRLAQEIALIASDSKAQVLWGRCYEGQGAPPYWPWVQIIRDYVRERDAVQLRSETGAGAASIAEIVPELGEKLSDYSAGSGQPLKPPSLDSPEANRFRLFDSITTFLKNASQSQPLMLVLEDLHWADRPSLLLLEFLAHEMSASRILVVGTLRHTESEHALSQTIGELARESYFQQIHLPRLEQADVGQYIQETSGARPSDELTDAVYSRTEGNPFFMTEMVRLFAQSGEQAETAASMPDSVRGAIRRRLEGLSGTCNQALTIASLVGREFSLDAVGALMSDTPVHQLLVELEEAAKLRIVDEEVGEVGRYQFSHVLVQEAISSELSNARKVALHAEIGESLERLYTDDVEAHAAELAYYFAEAETIIGPDKLVRYSLMAGDHALETYAWEDAQAHFERALAAKEGHAMDADKAALLFGVGRAQSATLERHRLHEAVNPVIPAFEHYVAAGDVSKALAIAEYPFQSYGKNPDVAQLIVEALKLVPSDSHHAGRLLLRYGTVLSSEVGNFETAVEALRQALAIAQCENDTALEMIVLNGMANAHWMMGLDPQESLENSLQAIELDRRVSQIQLGYNAHWHAARALIALGDLEGARPHAAAHLAMAEKRSDRNSIALALHVNEVIAHLHGNWETARDFSDRGLAVGHRDARLVSNRVKLEYELGDFDQGDTYLERLVETMRLSPLGPILEYSVVPLAIGMAARITGMAKQFDIAEAAADTVLSSPSPVSFYAQLVRTGLALMALERGDVAAAREQYDALRSWRVAMTPLILICSHRMLGLLAQTMGKMDYAVAHFEESKAFCRKAGYRPELAWTCYDYAAMLVVRPTPGQTQGSASINDAKALALLDEALAISTELGMRPLKEKVIALKANGESRRGVWPYALTYPAGLTEREVEVLLLIAQGKTTREIANELVISPRTVQRHTTNLYAKINARNRAEATAFALNELSTSAQTPPSK